LELSPLTSLSSLIFFDYVYAFVEGRDSSFVFFCFKAPEIPLGVYGASNRFINSKLQGFKVWWSMKEIGVVKKISSLKLGAFNPKLCVFFFFLHLYL
jgi:hypothetical protein